MEIINTHTGKIFVDTKNKLEFLTVGDYGKENNIKANFLGYNKEINGVKNTDVDLTDKWVATISTQHGCPMKCSFCDVHKYGFFGNVSREFLQYQVEEIIKSEPDINYTNRFNLHFARMGEPTFNQDIFDFTRYDLDKLVNSFISAKTIHPVISTMLPKNNKKLFEFILNWCNIKNKDRLGEAGLQFSINSTDELQREKQFAEQSLTLKQIALFSTFLPKPVGRKYTLNFAVTKDTILDAKKLSKMFDKNNFIVKITPIHETKSALDNGYNVTTSYDDYDVYRDFEQPLLEEGWDVIVFVPSKEEDSDRITCGNTLISCI